MVELTCGKQHRQMIDKIPLSNNTIHTRIKDISDDIREQVITNMKHSPHKWVYRFESTDSWQYSQLLVFVRFFHENEIKEEFLFCEEICWLQLKPLNGVPFPQLQRHSMG
jgi:hypothetical protein